MRAINHAVTGAVIGLAVGRPVIALPLAVVSHFVCDAIPHYDAVDSAKERRSWLRSRQFKHFLIIDAGLCAGLVLILAVRHPLNYQLAAACAFLAAAPDFLWVPKFLHRHNKREHKQNAFNRFAGRIQWFQKPIGSVVEVAWFVAGVILLMPFLY